MIEKQIRELADDYAVLLQQKINRRLQEMAADDHSGKTGAGKQGELAISRIVAQMKESLAI